MEFNVPKTNYYICGVRNGWVLLYGRKREFVYEYGNLEDLLNALQDVKSDDDGPLDYYEGDELLESWAEDAMYEHIDFLMNLRKEFKHYLSRYDSYLNHDSSIAIRLYDSRYVLKSMGRLGWEIVRTYDGNKLELAFQHCAKLSNLLYSLPNLLIHLKRPGLIGAKNPFQLYALAVEMTFDLIQQIKPELEAGHTSQIVAPHMRYEILNVEEPETGSSSA